MTPTAPNDVSISTDTLERAVVQGVLTPQQLEMLRYLEKTRTASAAEQVDDEKFRFISGFADIFVTIGIALFLGAISYFIFMWIGYGGAGLAVALASWLLAEYFTARRRMALPSIVLLLTYSAAVFLGMTMMIVPQNWTLNTLFQAGWPVFIAGLATIAATALHYWRFRVPITYAAGVAALIASIMALVFGLSPNLGNFLARPVLLVCGICVFALAMRFDLKDPQRRTKQTDIAFWLHMLAAPLVVHPLVSGLLGPHGMTAAAAFFILAVFCILAFVAVLVDRRAVLVSGLTYAGIAFGSLVRQIGIGDDAVPLTLLILGTLVLLLSAGWHSLRRQLLGRLPIALARQLPAHT